MKKLYILLLLLSIAGSMSISAQNNRHKGFALGVDNDTLLYIVASPFDNWYITFGGGIQTFIGNEVVASARTNKLNYNIYTEIGKWIIPDLAVSARLQLFNVDGQTQYGLQPFINKSEDTPNKNGYYPFHAYAISLIGFVTLDWTNFISGYETGRRNRYHIYMPIGLGASMLMGEQQNPRGNYEIGSFRKNFELSYSFGLGLEYEMTRYLALKFKAEIFGSESTWDWSPYDNSYSRFDVIPMFTVGARFNLLKDVIKYNPATKKTERQRVNHEFLSFGTRNTLTILNDRIKQLSHSIDSVQNLSDMRDTQNSLTLIAMNNELDNLQRKADSIQTVLNSTQNPVNIFEDIINEIDHSNLPSTIVYFKLDKYDLDFNGRKKLQNFSRQINNMDDTIQFYVIGAADSATGTARHNQWLSERRCETAYNLMTDYFDVDGDQLVMVPMGGITYRTPSEDNRMTMVIIKNETTEKIVNRWLRKNE